MIAGEYAEATRIKRQRIVHAKLGTEISNRVFVGDLQIIDGPTGPRRHIRSKSLIYKPDAFEINRIRSRLRQTISRRFREQLPGIVFTLFPGLRIEVAENAGAI